jgi:hypothetical protein
MSKKTPGPKPGGGALKIASIVALVVVLVTSPSMTERCRAPDVPWLISTTPVVNVHVSGAAVGTTQPVLKPDVPPLGTEAPVPIRMVFVPATVAAKLPIAKPPVESLETILRQVGEGQVGPMVGINVPEEITFANTPVGKASAKSVNIITRLILPPS